MKKFLCMLMALILALGLCACDGNEPAQTDPSKTEPSQTESTPSTGKTTEELIQIAKDLIDSPVEDLYAAIGEPESSDYAPSCLGDGEDGMLFYDGFVVYTYREGDTETVYDVE